ncbi:hypothetical protein Pyn_14399 [Prunus yedoensis var. nudiflora]|uniref:Uncharacterized protein n=1 Tax=Prunus yedoensis var. nudiflora TaxID=2094558 RepID=A0A314UPK6_PRUYE|nr:hypothetical protein Pyn_14399 [Prunus yedoensis var. nudiflora]
MNGPPWAGLKAKRLVRSNQIWPFIFLSSNLRPPSSIQSRLHGGGSPVSSAVRLPCIAVSASQPVPLSGGLCNVANWQMPAFEFGVCVREKLSAAAASAAGVGTCHFSASFHVS